MTWRFRASLNLNLKDSIHYSIDDDPGSTNLGSRTPDTPVSWLRLQLQGGHPPFDPIAPCVTLSRPAFRFVMAALPGHHGSTRAPSTTLTCSSSRMLTTTGTSRRPERTSSSPPCAPWWKSDAAEIIVLLRSRDSRELLLEAEVPLRYRPFIPLPLRPAPRGRTASHRIAPHRIAAQRRHR